MNQTSNETQKRKWGCGGCLLAFVAVLALLVVTRITLVWQDRESQTKQLYALAAQLGYTADSEVLRDKDWYCIDWDMFGRQQCTVFLAYTTALDAKQMGVLATTVGIRKLGMQEVDDRSDIAEYVLLNLHHFVPEIKESSTSTKTSDSKVTRLVWGLSTGNSYLTFYGIANLSPPFTLNGEPIQKNIIVIYGEKHIMWMF